MEKCPRCETMEDLLETATSERDKARDEASKADREVLSHRIDRFVIEREVMNKTYDALTYFRELARSLGATPSQMLEKD